jgi:hypothetical protein
MMSTRIKLHSGLVRLATALCFVLPLLAVTGQGSVAVAAGIPCSISGYSNDPDPKGQNIRKTPSGSAKIIARLPPPVTEDGFKFGPYFDILAVQGGWVKVTNASSWNGGESSARIGWISAKFVRFHLQTEVGFVGPSNKTQPIWHAEGSSFDESFSLLVGCSAEYAQVLPTGTDVPKKAWVRGVCAIQETTCDGLPIDRYSDFYK